MTEPLARVWSRPLPDGASPSSVTITKDGADRYFISILVEEDIAHLPPSESSIGADLGLKSFVVLSDGSSVGNPQCFAQDEKKLAKAQRRPRGVQRDKLKQSEKKQPESRCCLVKKSRKAPAIEGH
jgi:putative transposase